MGLRAVRRSIPAGRSGFILRARTSASSMEYRVDVPTDSPFHRRRNLHNLAANGVASEWEVRRKCYSPAVTRRLGGRAGL
jgi:hypothetical protein